MENKLLLMVKMRSTYPKDIPVEVMTAADAICNDPAFRERIQADWGSLGTWASHDRIFGQAAIKDSADYRKARDGLRNFLEWAGSDGIWARVLAPYEADENMSTADMEHQMALDCEAIMRMSGALDRCSSDGAKKKKKRFLPLLAISIVEWHEALNLPAPALSDTSPAVKLMRAIASAHKIELGPEAHRKALAAALSSRND